MKLRGSRDAGADGDGEFAFGDEGEAFCAGEVEGEVFEGPIQGIGDGFEAATGVLEQLQDEGLLGGGDGGEGGHEYGDCTVFWGGVNRIL